MKRQDARNYETTAQNAGSCRIKKQSGKRRFLALLLTFAMVFSLLPALSAPAYAANEVVLGSPIKNSDGTASFKSATIGLNVTGNITVEITVNNTNADIVKASLPTGAITNTVEVGDVDKVTYAMFIANKANAQAYLQAVKFAIPSSGSATVNVAVDGNRTNAAGTSITAGSGDFDGHYYMYVNQKLAWNVAYNAAKDTYYKGMRGYLATMTSVDEQNYLTQISGDGAWIGATALVKGSKGGDEINDDEELTASNLWVRADFVVSNPASENVTLVYYACGPEAGNRINNYTLTWGTDPDEPNASYVANATPAAIGYAVNGNDYESCIQANYTSSRVLNDMPEANSDYLGGVKGYFVEFSGYTGGYDANYSSNAKGSATATISSSTVQQSVALGATANMKWYSEEACNNVITAATWTGAGNYTAYIKANDNYYYPTPPTITGFSGTNPTARETFNGNGIYSVSIPYVAGATLTASAPTQILDVTGATFDQGMGTLAISGTYSGTVPQDRVITLQYQIGGSGDWYDVPTTVLPDKSFAINAISAGIASNTQIAVRNKIATTESDTHTITVQTAPSSDIGVDYYSGSNSGMGTVSVSPTGSVQAGTEITFTAIPTGNYAFVGWYDAPSGGYLISASDSYKTVMPNDDYTLYGKFQAGYIPTQIVNGSFEQPNKGAPAVAYHYISRYGMPGWSTTDDGFELITWYTSPSSIKHTIYGQTSAHEGTQYVEMNYNKASSALYQDLGTTPKDIIYWSVWHSARPGFGTQVLNVNIGDVHQTHNSLSPSANDWDQVSGVYVVPANQYNTQFRFTGSSGTAGCGNLLDDIEFKTLLGNVSITTTESDPNEATIKGYWGDAINNSSKTLMYEIVSGSTTLVSAKSITMSAPGDFSTDIDISDLPTGKHTIKVYHSQYSQETNKVSYEIEKHAPTIVVGSDGSIKVSPATDKNGNAFALSLDENGTNTVAYTTETGIIATATLKDAVKDGNFNGFLYITGADSTASTVRSKVALRYVEINYAGSPQDAPNYVGSITTAGILLGTNTLNSTTKQLVKTQAVLVEYQTKTGTGNYGTAVPEGSLSALGDTIQADAAGGAVSSFIANGKHCAITTQSTNISTLEDSKNRTIVTITIKSKGAMMTDGILPSTPDVTGGTTINPNATPDPFSGQGGIAEGLKDLIGKPDDAVGATDAEKAARNAFEEAFPDVDLTDYDKLTPAGQKEVLIQLSEGLLPAAPNNNYGKLGEKIAEDFTDGANSDLDKFAVTQYKLENSDPTNGSVSTIMPKTGGGLDIGVNLGTGGANAVTPTSGGIQIYISDPNGSDPELIGTSTGGASPVSIDSDDLDGKDAIWVVVTDTNGFKTVTKTVLNTTTVSGGYSALEDAAEPDATYGGMGGDTGISSKIGDNFPSEAEGTISATTGTGSSYTKYSPATVTYASGDYTFASTSGPAIGKKNPATIIKIEATPDPGAYVDGFYVTKSGETAATLITPENLTALLGTTGSAIEGPNTDGKYEVRYNPEYAGSVSVETRYRNLLGEINTSGSEADLAAILEDGKFATVFNGNANTGPGTTALAAYNGASNDQKAEIRGMLLEDVSRGPEANAVYSVDEFNAALENASRYIKARDAVRAALDSENREGYTAGSIAEAERVLAAVEEAYDSFTSGSKIAPADLLDLMNKLEKAENQLVPSTFSVEITPKLPPGVTITAIAAQPQTGAGLAQSVTLTNGQTGHVFPQYGTPVKLILPPAPAPATGDYDIYVGAGETPITQTDGAGNYVTTIASVKMDADVSVEYRRKDVSFTLPDGVSASTDNEGSEVKAGEGADEGKTIVTQSAGTGVTLTFAPGDGNSILPGATVSFDGGTTKYPVTVNLDGSYSVTVPANTLNGKDAAAITTALGTAATADTGKLAAMITKAEAVVGNDNGGYDIATDHAYTQESWEALKEALAVAEDSTSTLTDEEKANALEVAYKALVPQYAVTVPAGPAGLTVPVDGDGKPAQPGVVYDAVSDKYYVADGVSLQLAVAPEAGKKLDSLTYRMDTNGDGDTTDVGIDRTATAYPVNGVVTIPVIKGAITISTPVTSPKGFAVEDGPMGAATGVLDPAGTAGSDHSNPTDIYTVTPDTGSELTSVTVDGTKVGLPDEAELKAVLAAGQADTIWEPVDANDATKGATFTVDDVNGRDVVFTKAPVLDESGVPIPNSYTITSTLPGLGRVEVSGSGGTVTAKVLAKGATGLNVGTEIALTDAAPNIGSETIKVAAANGELTGAEIVVIPVTGAGEVKIDFGSANSGSHSVAATTTLKTYEMSLSPTAEAAGVLVNGTTSAAVKHGSALTITLPSPTDPDKEVGMDTTVTGTVNGVVIASPGMTLAALQSNNNLALKDNIEVTINADGSATLTIHQVLGETSISGVGIVEDDKDTAATATQLARDKSAVAALEDELATLLAEAIMVAYNDGELYDENTPEWDAFGDNFNSAFQIYSDLPYGSTLAAITTETGLVTALNDALVAGGAPAGHTSVADAIAAIRAAADELAAATEAAKIYAPGVVAVTGAVGYGDVGVIGEGITISPAATSAKPDGARINPDGTGAPLVISGIEMEDGYLPRVTVTTDKGEVTTDKGEKTFVVQENPASPGTYSAYEVTVVIDPDTGSETETVAGTAATGVSVNKDSVSGKFTVTFPNATLKDTLGFGDPADPTGPKTLGNITGIDVYGVKQGVILPSPAALKAGLQTGSTNGVGDGVDDLISVTMGADGTGTNVGNAETPVLAADAKAIITIPLSEDDYYGKATDPRDPKATIWNKTLTGVELEGKFYELQPDGTLVHSYIDDEGDSQTEILAGVTVEEIIGPAAKITIDTSAPGFNPGKDYTTLQLVLEPTNSQFVTFQTEFANLTKLIDEADDGKEDALGVETLAEAIKRVEKLIAEASGALPAPYALTTQNKDYLTGEVAQLGAYKDRLTSFYNAARVESDIFNIYEQIVDEMEIPIDPITDGDKATLAAMEEVINGLQSDYDSLTPYEKSLVPDEILDKLNALTDALQEAQRDGMSDVDKFDALVGDISKIVGSRISSDNADLIDSMIRAAEDMYIGMSDEDQAASAVAKDRLDRLKNTMDGWLEAQAETFAMRWLTTAYSAGPNINTPGAIAYNGDRVTGNRLDSAETKEGYADRILLARQKYDALSAAEQAAVDKLFKNPTITELYKEAFPALRGGTVLPDSAVADNFVEKYLSVNGKVISQADSSNYNKIIGAEGAWDALTPDQQDLVNEQLAPTSYEELLEDALVVKSGAGKAPALDKMTDTQIDALPGLSDEQKQALKDARDFINDHLKYDGSVITENNGDTRDTIRAAKGPWDGLSDLAKAAVNGALTGSYKGKAYEDLYSEASRGGGSGSHGGGAGASEPEGPAILVDGQLVSTGEVTVDEANSETLLVVDHDIIAPQLANATEALSIVVPTGTDAATAQLSMATLDVLAERGMDLNVRSGGDAFNIPAGAVDTAEVLAQLGADDAAGSELRVSVNTALSEQELAAVDAALAQTGAELVVPPVNFSITASSGGRSVEITDFESYVSATVQVTAAQAARITTAISTEPNGSSRHLPTEVFQEDGKWYARVHTLTNVPFALVWSEESFTDARGAWYESVVNEMASRRILTGVGDGLFEGKRDVTRAEFATMIVRALGLPEDGDASVFPDVESGAWCAGAVGKAYEYGIVKGRDDGRFDLRAPISRQEGMAMVRRAAAIAGLAGESGDLSSFPDANSVSPWALEDVAWNIGSGLVRGDDEGKINGRESINRAESATLILRLLQNAGLVDVRSKI